MKHRALAICAGLVVLLFATGAFAQGIFLSAAGPVNRSMGGASTAAPLDAIGALFWNPATTSSLEREVAFGVGLLLPVQETSSVVGPFAGSTNGEPGVTPIPNMGWVHREEGSSVTYGLGVLALAGVKTNYPSSTTNPFFAPQANTPAPGGFGGVFTQATFLQVAPTVSYAINDRLSIGGGPTLTLGDVIIDPLFVGPLNDADGSGVPRYGTGRGTRFHWGGGAQLGIYYIADNCWHLGASVKSPQWMEDFRFHQQDELGLPSVQRWDLDLPMIISLGVAYSGFENWTLALDTRYFDFRNANGFKQQGFAPLPDGRLTGLGFSSIFSVTAGAQYQFSDSLYLRGGYSFNQSPIRNWEASIGVPAPLYYQHHIYSGLSYGITENLSLNLAYTFLPEHTRTGSILTPAGPVAGSTVTTSLSAHLGSIGVSVKY